MKKLLAVAFVAMCSLSASAQVWVGGNLGLSVLNPKGSDNATTELTIAPTIGYKVCDKFEIGLELSETCNFLNGSSKNLFCATPFARYNFAESGIASFFVDGGISYINNDGTNGFGIAVRPGVKVELSEHWALETKTGFLGFRHMSDSYTSYGAIIQGEALSFGVVYEF